MLLRVAEGVGVVRAQYPLLIGQQLPEQPQRPAGITGLPGEAGDVVPGAEGVGMVRAQHPLLIGQQLPEQPQRLAGITALPGPVAMLFRVVRVSGWSAPRTRS